MAENYLIISDAHLPFEHHRALKFCKELKADFNIPSENIYNVGDFDDQIWASNYDKNPNGDYTANQEIKIVQDKIKEWASIFPKMKMCKSNHTSRYYKRAFEAELPSQILRNIEEILQYPKGWVTQETFTIIASHMPFVIQHGEGFSGAMGHREAAILNGVSTVIGHLHSNAGVNFIRTAQQEIWGMNVGCLVDNASYAFEYGRHSKFKPTVGCGVVLDGGKIPMFIPLV